MSLPEAPAERHRVVAATMTGLVEHVTDWDAEAPVPGWTARDVVGHLVDWFPAFLAAGSEHRISPGPAIADDPVGAWAAQVAAVQALLEDDQALTSDFAHPYVPRQPLASAITNFYVSDIFMHSWDLAAASGQPIALDEDLCRDLLDGLGQMEEVVRSSGQYGPAVAVPEDAPVQDRLIGFIGRDPQWRRDAAD